MKFFAKLLIVLLCPLCIAANHCSQPTNSLDELIQLSTNIIEAEIIAQQSFWDADSLNILTAHSLKILQGVNLKQHEQPVVLITKGGQVENDYMVFSGTSFFQVGDEGLFFTELSEHNFIRKQDDQYLSLINSKASFIHLYPNDTFVTIQDVSYQLKTVYQKISKHKKTSFVFQEPSDIKQKVPKKSVAITKVSPLTIPANDTEVLTIKGTGFGTLSEAANVYLPNCNQPSGVIYIAIPKANISFWNDKEIRIKVPGFDIKSGFPGVGSGLVKIQTASGVELTSAQRVTITYNQKKLNNVNIDLISHANNGEIPFYISKSLVDDGALPAIERAMDLWYCQTGIKFSIIGTVNEACYKTDNKNVISYDDDCSIAQLGFTRLLVSGCGSGNEVYLRDLDIIINHNRTWSFDLIESPIGTSDFASTILHELGHAHLLGHVLNKEDILFPIVQREATKKELIEHNKTGGSKILEESKFQNSCATYKPAMAFKDGFCCNPVNELSINYVRDNSAAVNFAHGLSNIKVQVRFRKTGHQKWNEISTTRTSLVLNNLQACSGYEVQVSEACNTDNEVQFDEDNSVWFETSGCISCDPPGELFSTGISTNAAFLNWDVVPNRSNYEMQYRIDYSGEWKYYQSAFPIVILFDLPECTAVQYRMRTYCADEISTFSRIHTLKTKCGGDKQNIPEINQADFLLSPNPVKNYLTIFRQNTLNTPNTQLSNAYFLLKDINGKLIEKGSLMQSSYVLNLNNRVSGVYFLELYENGKRSVQKFIKE